MQMDRTQGESLNLHHFEKVTCMVRPKVPANSDQLFAEVERWHTPAGDFLFRLWPSCGKGIWHQEMDFPAI